MSKINVLDSSVFNRIAAGEVVEKPSSVVKELVENAIDSGATKIDIDIAEGGKYIKVMDNGSGIAFGDLPTAFLPHATSKIKEISDLESIGTLGFRGEALPSIASVAKITMISRKRDDELGGEIVIENGKQLYYEPKGAPYGTTVIVSDLFKNVPARLKFLRSERSEEGDITALVQKIIISNYKVAFSYTVGNKEIYRTDGKGLKESLYAVYGANFLKEYDYLSCTMPDIAIYGYVNKPAFSKHNRSYQTLIVNGRYVINSDISFWIYNCYSDYLMKRQYPAYVLFIDIPNDMVDINVHPSKMEVKFVDFDRIRKMLTRAIAERLDKSTTAPKLIELDINEKPETPKSDTTNFQQTNGFKGSYESTSSVEYPRFTQKLELGLNSPEARGNDVFTPQIKPTFFEPRQHEIFHDIVANESGISSDNVGLDKFKYCGKLFNTYLILERENEIVLIDQHAAHEKILYDDLSNAVNEGAPTIQDLLMPYIFDVDQNEAELIMENIEEISALGFSLYKLSGNTFSLSSVPLILSEIRLKDFVALLIEALKKDRLSKHGFIKEELMQSACKSAVKGEMNLSESEVNKLIETIVKKKIDLFCPHGRPIAIKIKRSEIEKWFKRIV